MLSDVLSDFKQFLPIRKFLVQEIKTTPDERITKEAKPNTSIGGFHEHGRASQ